VSCLLGGAVVRPELVRRLRELGLDLEALRRCVSTWCKPSSPAPIRPGIASIASTGVAVGTSTVTSQAAPTTRMPSEIAELVRQLAREVGVDCQS
jgi:hypothetical protein